ncbi:prion-inhibition and propagation-domain-containing protein [Leptodontidium sp. MPI-SDFR-AT-0119]|nr:prion-inhibition and propagation-domain-containing protein [Leptodontidium sp. MPI-SDFR-AT-0119]
MDPGTALAVVSLSFQVFGGIIKGFTLLAKAHNLGQDATLLQTMLCVEESRFIQWARAVELLKDSDLQSSENDGNDLKHDTATTQDSPGAVSEGSIAAHSVADEASLEQVPVDSRLNYTVASQLMAQLQIMLTTDGLRQRYKLDLVETPDVKSTLAGPKTTSLIEENGTATTVLEKLVPDTLRQRILLRAKVVQKNNHLPKRLWWAAVDKQKFENMVCDVRGIVNGLWNLLDPVQREDSSATLRQILAGVIQISQSVSELRALQQSEVADSSITPTYADDVVSLAADLKLTRIEIKDIKLAGKTEARSVSATLSAMNRSMLTNVTQKSINVNVAQGFYDGQPVWIEYKDVPQRLKGKLASRVKNLALLLALTKSSSFHTLRCQGYLEEEARFVFIYHWPKSSISQISRETQFAMSLTELIRDAKTFAPISITDRLQVARELCKTLLGFHTAGWLHKDIRSDNVMFFQENGWSKPYVTGFSFARQDSPSEISEQPSKEPLADIYRHPHALGEPSTSFQKHMDMYSLGLLLLELAEWKALKHIVAKCVEIRKIDSNVGVKLDSIAEIPKWLDKQVVATGQLKFRMGDIYADVVHTCLRYGMTNAEECPDTLPDLLQVVRNLERIWV